MDGEGVHVNLWRQDAREEEGTDETWGVTFFRQQGVRRWVEMESLSSRRVFPGRWR
jgi:hypothetical protein